MIRSAISVSGILLFLLIALEQNSAIAAPINPNFLISQASDNRFCPNGFEYDKNYRLCVSDKEALGPFTNEMIAKCKASGGGTAACEGIKWEINFARSLRGKTICHPGARFDFETSQCVEGKNVYGPFTEEIVAKCKASGEDSVCDTMRYSRTVFPRAFNFPAPTPTTSAKTYTLWATNYYAHPAASFTNGVPLLTPGGNPLGHKLSARDWCLGGIEGTIEVTDRTGAKTTYNYAGLGSARQVNCQLITGKYPSGKERYKISEGPYGEGVALSQKTFNLVPFRSIAVDKNKIPIGSVIFIPSARGITITLPSGETVTHDGYFMAADVGTAIKNNHIDVFTGISKNSPFSFVTGNENQTFQAILINNTNIEQALKAMHQLKF